MTPDEDKKIANESQDVQGEDNLSEGEKPTEPAIQTNIQTVGSAVHNALKDTNEPETEKTEETKEAQITQYLKTDLPETEERIKTPMNPNCEVSVVIPAYGEWDYVLRPLESLAKQKGVTTDQYEVIIVVNNPADPPTQHEDESPSFHAKKLAHYNQAVLENQKTIDLIRYINGENVGENTGENLSPAEREKADNLKRSGLKIHYIDKASIGKNLPKDEANVGGARNRGVAEAIERFYALGRNGIIAQTDADTSCDSNYIHGLIEVFEENPKLVGLAGSVKLDDSSANDELLKLSSSYTRLNSRYDYVLKLLKKEPQTKETETQEIGFCGANMASRAFETAMIGGIPKMADREDFEFGRRLSKIGEVTRDSRVKTMPMDRLSARTGIHGHGYRKLSVADSISQKGSIYIPDPEGGEEIPLEEAASKIIKILCTDEKIRSKYESFRAELIAEENKWREDRTRIVETLLDVTDVDSLVQTINSTKGTFGLDITEDGFLDDLSKGFAVSRKFVEIVTASKTKQDAIRELQSAFSEDLTPIEENLVPLRSLELKALYKATR